MLLRCNATWIAEDTGSRYEVGNVYDVQNARATTLYHSAPAGTFDVLGQDPPTAPRTIARPEPTAPVAPETMSAPDRSMRGGLARSDESEQATKTQPKKRQPGGRRPQ